MPQTFFASWKWLSPLIAALALCFTMFVMVLGVVSFLLSRGVMPRAAYDFQLAGSVADGIAPPNAPVVLLTYDGSVDLRLAEVQGLVEVSEGVERAAGLATAGLSAIPATAGGDASSSAAEPGWEGWFNCGPTNLLPGQRVRTGADSGAWLHFSDGRKARLGPGAEIALVGLGDGSVALVLYRGETLHEIVSSPALQ